MRRGTWLAAAGLALLLAGCSVAANDAAEAPAEGVDAGAGEVPAPAEDEDAEGRAVITTGWVTMTVDEPRAVAQQVARLAESVGGWVAERTESQGDNASAHLVIRVPAQDLTSTLERLETLGTVEDVSISRTDVTLEVTDLESRIRAYELSVARLEALLEGAATTADVVEAESMLTDRQAELESLRSRAAVLADQVEMSTLEVSLWTPDAVPDDPEGFWGGIVRGWDSLLDALGGLLLAIGIAIPWLAFLALVAAVIVISVRASRRRRTARAPSAAPTRPGPTTTLPVAPAAAPAPSAEPDDQPR